MRYWWALQSLTGGSYISLPIFESMGDRACNFSTASTLTPSSSKSIRDDYSPWTALDVVPMGVAVA